MPATSAKSRVCAPPTPAILFIIMSPSVSVLILVPIRFCFAGAARVVGRGAEGRRLAEKLAAVRDGHGIGLLHAAAFGGSLPVCRYLVEDLRMDVAAAGQRRPDCLVSSPRDQDAGDDGHAAPGRRRSGPAPAPPLRAKPLQATKHRQPSRTCTTIVSLLGIDLIL